MSFDNIQFNVNGLGLKGLEDCLGLALRQRSGMEDNRADEFDTYRYESFRFDPKHGLLLYRSAIEGAVNFLAPIDAKTCAQLVNSWLQTSQADLVELKGMDKKYSGDASNSKGWRVHCGEWGHIGDHRDWSLVCAVTPSYLWHGK
jgi:hypothetical protein